MSASLQKSILELDDLQGISPNFDHLAMLPKATAQKIETLFFARDKNTFKILTTNNFPE